jgi:cell division protein FtsX
MPMKGKAYRKRKAVTVGYIVIALLSFFIAMDFFFRFNILAGLGALIAVLIIVFI